MKAYIGKNIYRYRITEQLGMGGMAVVYKAYDTRLEREVALKLIRTETIPQNQLDNIHDRFDQEARVHANLIHRNIARIYDYGEDDGFPFIVLPFFPGGSLKDKIGSSVNFKTALRWIEPIADALSYSHRQGVIHRDVKPSNVMFDEEDCPVLTDFGIAKIFDFGDTNLTGTGLGLGTPDYMAPEQWHGSVSESIDQYALGVTLYEVITGKIPYQADTAMELAILQATEPIQAPSTLIPGVPVGIDLLLNRALAFDSEDRFEHMSGFLLAIKGLANDPAASVEEIFGLEKRRHQTHQQDTAHKEHHQSAFEYPLGHKEIEDRQSKTEIDFSEQTSNTKLQTASLQKWLWWSLGSVGFLCVVSIFLITVVFNVFGTRDADSVNESVSVTDELSSEVADQIMVTPTTQDQNILSIPDEEISTFPDQEPSTFLNQGYVPVPYVGPRGVDEDEFEFINPSNAHKVTEIARFGKGITTDIAWHPTQPILAVGSSIGIRFYEGEPFQEIQYIDTESWVNSVAFSPDGGLIASGGQDNQVRLYDVESGRLLVKLEGHTDQVNSVDFSQDGKSMASGSADHTIRLWDISTGHLIGVFESDPVIVNDIKFSPDGTILASASYDWSVRLWEIETGRLFNTLEGHTSSVSSLSFSPNGDLLATGGQYDESIRIWEVLSGRHLRTIDHSEKSFTNFYSLAFSPIGGQLATESFYDESIILWNVETGEKMRSLVGNLETIDSIAYSADGHFIAASYRGEPVHIWDTKTGQLHGKVKGYTDSIESSAISPDGSVFALGGSQGIIYLQDIKSGDVINSLFAEHPLFGSRNQILSLSFSTDGSVLASGDFAGLLRLWDMESGQLIKIFHESEMQITSVEFSKSGNMLISAGWDSTIRLWDVETGKLNETKQVLPYVHNTAISSDARWLAVSEGGNNISLWDLNTGQQVNTLNGYNMVFSPDGGLLATDGKYESGLRGPIQLYETRTGNIERIFGEPNYGTCTLAFSPDGNVLASGNNQGNIQLWDVETGQLINKLEGHNGWVTSLNFSPNGGLLSSTSSDGTFRIWVVNKD